MSSSDYGTIIVEQDGPAGVITLNRPEKYNAINRECFDELLKALNGFDNDDSVRGVILAGHEKFFSTGADLNYGRDVSKARDSLRYLDHQRQLTERIEQLTKPVIAAISGYCITGGFELALACDLRVADETAKFGITSSKIGSMAGLGGTQRLPRLIGPGRAKELLFSSDFIDAATADRFGILNRLVPKGEAVAEAKKMIAVYAKRAPISIWLMKRAVNVGSDLDLDTALYLEAHSVALTLTTEDRREGWAAFLEKRDAKFEGK